MGLDENFKYRVRIQDIAEELGVSTATVSNVINGKTKKVSEKTIERVQKVVDERNYIPNMAAILLAQNNSKIICIVISNHDKYEGQTLQDPFVTSLLDSMAHEIERNNYFMMIKLTDDLQEIVRYSSMWNMAGLVLIGFCTQDYNSIRKKIRIPFVVMDGFFEPSEKCANIGINDFQGGYLMGQYLIKQGHRNVMYVSDNDLCMDHNRFMGLKKAYRDILGDESTVKLELIPLYKDGRYEHYQIIEKKMHSFTTIFCASDAYAIEIMNYLIDNGHNIPDEVSIAGFDNIAATEIVRPALTTIKQDISLRAKTAVQLLNDLINGNVTKDGSKMNNVTLPVELVERNSVRNLTQES